MWQSKKKSDTKNRELLYNGIPLIFESMKPNNWGKFILNYCASFFERLDQKFFVKGPGQNSDFGIGRFFWEKNINLLMFIGFIPFGRAISLSNKNAANYSFCIGVNTETMPSNKDLNCSNMQVHYRYSNIKNWLYVPIEYPIKKENGKFSEELMEATTDTLVTVMKISRLCLELSFQRFINSRNKTK